VGYVGVAGSTDIKVTPAALGAAAVVVRDVGERVRESAETAAGRGADLLELVGDPACGQALANAERLLQQALLASAAGVLSLSRALNEAGDTYSLAEASAVPTGPHR
jgi:hypothetical protein